MKKNEDLLGSGGWFYVEVQNGEKVDKIVLEEKQYRVLEAGLDRDAKYVQIWEDWYFWSKIQKFWPLKFDEGVLSKLKELPTEVQNFIKSRIRRGVDISTIDKLRSEVALFYN